MRNGLRIVDTDCHQIEPASMWKEYIEPAFGDRAPRAGDLGGRRGMMVEGESVTCETGKYPMSPPEFHAAVVQGMRRFERAAKRGFDAASRLEDMDEQGVDVQVIYPTVGGQILGKPFRDRELLSAICRAYNDWTRDYCSADPQRLRWAAMLPMQFPDLALEEATRAAQRDCVGFYVRPNPVEGRDLSHPDNERLWTSIEALGRPICIHDSGSPYWPSYGDRMVTHTAGHILAHPFEAMSAMMCLIWFGVIERHPRLRVVHVEADAGWVPYWLQRMEQHWEFSGNAEHPELKKPPTEYFLSNFLVAARGDERTLPAAISLVGDRSFAVNTDYPHPDGTWPWGIDRLVANEAIPQASRRRILWDNAAEAFGLEA